jgi:hypothetical protein
MQMQLLVANQQLLWKKQRFAFDGGWVHDLESDLAAEVLPASH